LPHHLVGEEEMEVALLEEEMQVVVLEDTAAPTPV